MYRTCAGDGVGELVYDRAQPAGSERRSGRPPPLLHTSVPGSLSAFRERQRVRMHGTG
jgi:hypothetical protein